MQFGLKSLFIAVTFAGVAAFLVAAAPVKAAISILALMAGTSFAVIARRRFPRSCKAVGIGTALFFLYMLTEGLLIAMRPVLLRESTPDDKLRDKYFCIQPMPEMTTRNIVVAEGTFARDTWLTGVLYLVRNGSVQDLNGFTVGRSPARLGEPEWIGMQLTMALADAKKSKGRVTQLGVAGQTRGGGNGSDGVVHNVAVTARKKIPGRMDRGKMRIVYVEGDHDARR